MKPIKNNGIDYILKPFKDATIRQALSKYKKLIGTIENKIVHQLNNPNKSQVSYQAHFLSQFRDKPIVINTKILPCFLLNMKQFLFTRMKAKSIPYIKKQTTLKAFVIRNLSTASTER